MEETFLAWKGKLNELVEFEFQVSLDDLPEFNFADWYKVGVGNETALEIIKEEIKLMLY